MLETLQGSHKQMNTQASKQAVEVEASDYITLEGTQARLRA